MKRPEAAPTHNGEPGVMPDTKFAERYPLLSAHLADDRWEDGKDREVSTIVYKVEDGHIVAALNDREARASLYRTGDTLEAATKALEKALGASGADWRPWGGNKKKGR